jgi:hypothetical protein
MAGTCFGERVNEKTLPVGQGVLVVCQSERSPYPQIRGLMMLAAIAIGGANMVGQ